MWRDVVDGLLGMVSCGLALAAPILFFMGHHDAAIFSIGVGCWLMMMAQL